MPRARSENSLKAEKLYREGRKLTDIAKELGVPDGTVRRWKHDHDWDGKTKKKQTERSDKKKSNARKRGAPKGNKNGVGHGPPIGNKNAQKHGAYSAVYWDMLDEDEMDIAVDMSDDEEMLLIEQIKLYSIRERRIMKAINKYRNGEPLYIDQVSRSEGKRSFASPDEKETYEKRIAEKVEKGDRLPGDQYNIITYTQNADNMVLRMERELSTVQSKKTKAIEALYRLRLERQKIEGDGKGNELVRVWAASVLKARGNQNAGQS